MTRLQEAIGLGLVLGAIHGLLAPVAKSVPVVPNFTQGSMTSHTETTSTVTETINSMDYNTGYQYSVTGSGVEPTSGTLSPTTGDVNVTIEGVNSKWTGVTATPTFKHDNTRSSVSVHANVSGPGLSNHTIIQRETTVTSVTDTTSIFQQ